MWSFWPDSAICISISLCSPKELCDYLSSTVSTYGAPHTLQAPATRNNCSGCCLSSEGLHNPCMLPCCPKAADNVCYLFTNQAINLLSTDLPSKLSIYRSIYLFFYPSVYLSPLFCDLCRRSSRSVARSRSVYVLSIHLSLSLPIYCATHLSHCLSTYLQKLLRA